MPTGTVPLGSIGYREGQLQDAVVWWKRAEHKTLVSAGREGVYADAGQFIVYLLPNVPVVLDQRQFDQLVLTWS